MNYKKMPKQEEVTDFDLGNNKVQLIELTDENRDYVAKIAISMYADEPCRICGENITIEDLHNHAVFAGYSSDSKSRTAHKGCWENRPDKSLWAFPFDEE